MSSIIDTHCHLDFDAFDIDREAVLAKCVEHNVSDIVVPAVTQHTWSKTIELCHNNLIGNNLSVKKTSANAHNQNSSDDCNENTPKLHLALGLHPIFIEQHQPQHLVELDKLVQQHNPSAIGEIGLDFYRKASRAKAEHDKPESVNQKLATLERQNREKQTVFFSKQLIIAKQHNLPVIIHNRKAHDECVSLLQDINVVGGIIHNFNGSIQHAHKYMELGFKLGFGGMLTFERSRVIRSLAKQIPIEAIVLETDAPDLTVQAHKGERNSPEYLPHVLSALATVKNMSAADVARITSNNAKQVLQL